VDYAGERMGDGLMPTFTEHLGLVRGWLAATYPELDFSGDFALANKVEEIAHMITQRLNNPAPDKTGATKSDYEAKQQGWRRA
jgi:hypothetical protein